MEATLRDGKICYVEMPAVDADRGFRRASRLPRARPGARHAGGQHRAHAGPLPGQATSRPRLDERGRVMTEMSSEELLEVVRTVWEQRDPLPV